MKKNKIKKCAIALLGIIALLFIGAMMQAQGIFGDLFAYGSVLTAGAIVPMADIEDVGDIDVAGESLSYRIRLIRVEDIDTSKKFVSDESKPGAIKQIPLKEGAKISSLHCHALPEFSSKGSKGDITVSGESTVTAVIGGFREQTLRFLEEYVGRKFLLIIEECGAEEKAYLVGTKCKPMVLTEFDNRNNKDSRSCSITFQNKSILQPIRYTGGETNGAG
ncbi:hypothetical protein [Porphyromonas gingivalis]|uniref:Uncharacterized protein n=1 Tax=Porphyromonas phage phage030a_KCOM2803 TaxID=3154120 RepID=A0AAT9J9C8_9CAUD|nr:hypothetical protein [Porphyromonas gingivalis]ATR92746.1 hypothetical protein CS545_06500 [Porphyromonas gingivalis]